MSRVGFELTILVFEREKTFHALHSAATMIDSSELYLKTSDVPGQYKIMEPVDGRNYLNPFSTMTRRYQLL
jgi:hypothetical protein